MDYSSKTIGIWGFGRVGKSAARFLKERGARIVLYDDNIDQIADSGYLAAPTLQAFFDSVDCILPSPGIDTRAYRSVYQGKWLCELDLFSAYFLKPVIGITGSLGKTTVTKYLTHILQENGLKACAAGNIGTPMLDIISEQQNIDIAVLELSSFQLEYSNIFAPDLAIWTNFHPNHLDRHSMDGYFYAKYNLIAHQNSSQKALLPYQLKERIGNLKPKSTSAYFLPDCLNMHCQEDLYCYNKSAESFHRHGFEQTIKTSMFPATTYRANWLTIWAACTMLGISLKKIPAIKPLEHRLEPVATIKGILFINDSKSTTPDSMLNALDQFPHKKIALIMGGLSKGVDRTPYLKKLKLYNVTALCYGNEADLLHQACKNHHIVSYRYPNLEKLIKKTLKVEKQFDVVLFSPGGSSFDLYKNYEERGNMFKQMVCNISTTLSNN